MEVVAVCLICRRCRYFSLMYCRLVCMLSQSVFSGGGVVLLLVVASVFVGGGVVASLA